MPISFINRNNSGNISLINRNNSGTLSMSSVSVSSIVTAGLIVNLDAGNPASYPGSGTTWTDLSGNNNSGSLVNGPTFSSANGGSIAFDGSNDYVSLPANFFNPNSGTPFTVSLWFKTSTAGLIFGQQNTSTPNSSTGYVPAIYADSNGKIRTSCFWGGATSNQSVSTLNVTDNTWHNITVTFASNSQISYLDGNSFATLSKTQNNYSSVYYYFIGTGTWNGWPNLVFSPFFTGNIANMVFYNRALTDQEILQNYNAQKSRFGL